jgi:hypothetical protein
VTPSGAKLWGWAALIVAVAVAVAGSASARAGEPLCPRANPRSAFTLVGVAKDYATRRPIAGATITISHRVTCSKMERRAGEPQCSPTHPHPAEALTMRCMTSSDGRAVFPVPDLDYEVTVKGPAGTRYLEPWEIAKFERAIEQTERLQQTTTDGRTKTMTVETALVPASVIEAPGVIQTPDRAIAAAQAALTTCLPPGTAASPRAQNWSGQWRVDFSMASVDVNAITGAARVVICRAECCQDPKKAPTDVALYAPADAIADASAGRLEHIGTGVWPGIFQIPSCVYRNDRVIVVDVYCTLKEINSFSIIVFHPTRGRVKVYAEARAPISTLERHQYLQWKAQAADPPRADQVARPLRTTMTFAEIIKYEEEHYKADLPGCWIDSWSARTFPPDTPPHVIKSFEKTRAASGRGQCRRKTAAAEAAWTPMAAAFERDPPTEWYPLVKRLRDLARRHGKPDPRGHD